MENNESNEVMNIQKSSQHDEILARAEQEATNFMNPAVWKMMKAVAQTFLESGALPKGIDTGPKLMMILQAGREAGMQPLQAINSFYLVNGKVAMYGEQCIAQVRKFGHKVEFINCSADQATCRITRGDTGESLEQTFTMQMATERGLVSNPVYKKYPENMMKFKAFHAIAKFIVPDALKGIDVVEVLQEVEPEKPQGTVEVIKNQSIADAQKKEPAKHPSLEDKLNEPDPEPEPEEDRSCCGGKTKHLKKCSKVNPPQELEEVEAPTTESVAESVGSEDVKRATDKLKEVDQQKAEESPIRKTLQENMERGKQQFHQETNEQKFNRITIEMADRRLTPEEAQFMESYPNFDPQAPANPPLQEGLV